jgi:hypothetical protein
VPSFPPKEINHLKEAQLARWIRRCLLEARAAAGTARPWSPSIFAGVAELVKRSRAMNTELGQVFEALRAEPDAGSSAAIVTL